jgi:hypothetical protein
MNGMTLTRYRPASGWHVSLGFNSMIDFCVWLLEEDGMQLAPFDRHPGGHGLLRTMGIDPVAWRRWLHHIVLLQAEPEPASSRLWHHSHLSSSAGLHTAPQFDPPALWTGRPHLRAWLGGLWQHYGPLALERRGQIDLLEQTLVERWLHDTLEELHPRLQSLHIHLVRYPRQVIYRVAPHSLVVALDDTLRDHATLCAAVREAAEQLAADEDDE